ncbi:MAG: UbiA prenyltransferase family protein [Thermoplasmatota archaeon]
MKIREYLKLARSFNAVLTGISPVMGAIAMQQYDLSILFLLFLVGFLGHTYGFVLNDIVDYKIDKSSKEIKDRPLISGTISLKNAKLFAYFSLSGSLIVGLFLAYITQIYFPVIILLISGFFITIYNLISKKYPFTDIFVSLGIFFLILYGSFTVEGTFSSLTNWVWFICLAGSIQTLFMQIVAGGMKDVENDFKKGAHTLAIQLGVRITNGKLNVSAGFKALAFGIQLFNVIVVLLPFFVLLDIRSPSLLNIFQWFGIGITSFLMFYLSYRLLFMKEFDRMKARKFIGSHYITNFALAPILLMALTPWAGVIIFFPALGFVFSNVVLHGTILQPKTM